MINQVFSFVVRPFHVIGTWLVSSCSTESCCIGGFFIEGYS